MGNPKDRFSRDEARIGHIFSQSSICFPETKELCVPTVMCGREQEKDTLKDYDQTSICFPETKALCVPAVMCGKEQEKDTLKDYDQSCDISSY